MNRIECPHCQNTIRQDKAKDWIKKDGDVHFCNFCSEPSIYIQQKSALRFLTDEEIKKNDENDINDPDWLPKVNTNDLTFEVVIIREGIFNPNIYEGINFHEAQRLLKLNYHKFGIIPAVSDVIEANFTDGEANDFVIIGRQMGVDNYDVMSLFVVDQYRWLSKMKW